MTSKNLVLIEDSEVEASFVKAVLRESDFEVFGPFTLFEEIVPLMKEKRIDLILADIQLGRDHEDGLSIAEKIMKVADPAFVVFTSSSDELYVKRATRLLAEAYLEKPVNAENLLQTLNFAYARKQIDRSRAHQPKTTQPSLDLIKAIEAACADFIRQMAADKSDSNVRINSNLSAVLSQLGNRPIVERNPAEKAALLNSVVSQQAQVLESRRSGPWRTSIDWRLMRYDSNCSEVILGEVLRSLLNFVGQSRVTESPWLRSTAFDDDRLINIQFTAGGITPPSMPQTSADWISDVVPVSLVSLLAARKLADLSGAKLAVSNSSNHAQVSVWIPKVAQT